MPMNKLSISLTNRSILSTLRRISTNTNPPYSIPIAPLPPPHHHHQPHHQKFSLTDFTHISNLLSNPNLQPGPHLEHALEKSKINPDNNLILEIFNHFDSSPKPLFAFFKWSEKQPGYTFSRPVFNAVVNSLCKGREFDSAWGLILDRVNGDDESERPDFETFGIMIRRYARAGFPLASIRTFKYASSLTLSRNLDSEKNLFEILLDSLCKEGHVKLASEYLDKHKAENPSWSPSIRVYNILLNGYFRSRKLKKAEQIWVQMKRDNIKPTVVTYGTLIEGLCRMCRPEMAMELLEEMKTEKIEPNAIVYNPIIDALGEDGRFKEALGMLERFSILESGPTISTYNSLVKGFCKAGDISMASKILKMMLENKCSPSMTTYGYFFKYFAKSGKIEEAMNLYTKLIRCRYKPDRLVYHLLVKMLCMEGKIDLLLQIISEMRASGCDLDLAVSTMVINLLCEKRKFDDAFKEFEDMIRRGIAPQHLTYCKMREELMKRGMTEMARKLYDLIESVPHSKRLPDTYRDYGDNSRERKMTIMKKAEAMSDVMKTCKETGEAVGRRNLLENDVLSAEQLTENIKRKTNLT